MIYDTKHLKITLNYQVESWRILEYKIMKDF